jgi:hypothetical protein
MCLPSLAITITDCKTYSLSNCFTGHGTDNAFVGYDYITCATGEQKSKTIIAYFTSCIQYDFECIDLEGYTKIICNNCLLTTDYYDYFCDACA